MDGQLQNYVLTRLDDLKATVQDSHKKLDDLTNLVRALPEAQAATMSPSFISRLEKWLPLLRQVGTMLVKHIITVGMIVYMVRGGDALQAAEMLLKLL